MTDAVVSVVGLGYVGLPLALAFGQHGRVVGYDPNEGRVAALQWGHDPNGEVAADAFGGTQVTFTTDADALREATFHVVAVPTPIDVHRMPDLAPLRAATETVAGALKPGDCVVYESTVYPGCTEEVCVPILEERSGLRYGTDFQVGYSPERINPGDPQHGLGHVVKVVSGGDAAALARVATAYEQIVPAGVYRAASVRVAEAAKVIENTQRDLNIALMNELSQLFDRLGLNTYDVLEAAATKWNFQPFTPGLVGGHCIGVDPYYLTFRAREAGYDPRVILAGRHINDGMAAHVAKRVVQHLVKMGKAIAGARVLQLGVTFKENVSDIRNSKAAALVNELRDFGVRVDVADPLADADALHHHYGLRLTGAPEGPYDAIILAVPHRAYQHLTEPDFCRWAPPPALLADLKGTYRRRVSKLTYWSL